MEQREQSEQRIWDLAAPALLAVRVRSGAPESAHYGHLVLVDPAGQVLLSRGAPEEAIYARSTLKPVQALPLIMTGAADRLSLDDRAIAIACASHAGQPEHEEAVRRLLDAAGLAPEQLGCGTHEPLHPPTALALAKAGQAPSLLQCNCSGKHAAMLATCQVMGWDLASYRAPDHPLQRAVLAALSALSGVPEAAIGHGVDGCGVPVWRLPLCGLARTFARLANPQDLPDATRAAAERVVKAMTAYPELVSGEGRLDTLIMQAGRGRLLAKIGGEGVHAGGVVGGGIGWAIKVLDGNRRAIAPALARALEAVGQPLPETPELAAFVRPAVTNNHGAHLGVIEPGW